MQPPKPYLSSQDSENLLLRHASHIFMNLNIPATVPVQNLCIWKVKRIERSLRYLNNLMIIKTINWAICQNRIIINKIALQFPHNHLPIRNLNWIIKSQTKYNLCSYNSKKSSTMWTNLQKPQLFQWVLNLKNLKNVWINIKISPTINTHGINK